MAGTQAVITINTGSNPVRVDVLDTDEDADGRVRITRGSYTVPAHAGADEVVHASRSITFTELPPEGN